MIVKDTYCPGLPDPRLRSGYLITDSLNLFNNSEILGDIGIDSCRVPTTLLLDSSIHTPRTGPRTVYQSRPITSDNHKSTNKITVSLICLERFKVED